MFLFKGDKQHSLYFEKNSRSDINECELCKKSFNSLFTTKHKCKRCHRYICSSCGKLKSIIIGIDQEKSLPHRTCDACISELKRQDHFIEENELKWNFTSKLSFYWLTFVKMSPDKLTYLSYRELYKKDPHKYAEDYEVILRDIEEGRTDLEVWNYSLRSFLYKLQTLKNISKEEARENIKHVLEALLVKYPQIGYCQGMNYIVGYILCFAEEVDAFELFSHLVDKVLPLRFFQKSEKGTGLLGVLAEKHVLKRLMQDSGLFKTSHEIDQAEDFLDLKAPQWLLSLLVNILDFEGTYHIFNMLFEWGGSFSQIEKAILLIVHKKLPEFLSFGNDSMRITDSITRDINLTVLQGISQIPVDEKMRFNSYMEYMKEFAEKWNQTDRLTHRKLEKITYFTKEEIEMLQKEFLFLIEDREKRHSKKQKKKLKINNEKSYPEISTHPEIVPDKNDPKHLLAFEKNKSLQLSTRIPTDSEISKENEEDVSRKSLMTNEKKSKKMIKGITKSDFMVIMAILNKKDIDLKQEDLDRMFEVFDDDNSGTLDFREFLCSMSLIMRGTIHEKLEMCFNLFDKDNKGYLNKEEGVKMIETLVKSLELTIDKKVVKEDVIEFQKRLMERIKGKEQITMVNFHGIETDPLVIEVSKKHGKK